MTVATQPQTPPADIAGGTALLEVRGLSKRYPGVNALSDIDFDLRAGEVHILFGENGAGKSTLISILSGAQKPSEGEVLFRGRPLALDSVHQARELGISAVYQEFSLVPQLTVAENMFLGSEHVRHGLLDSRQTKTAATKILADLGFLIDPNIPVSSLSRAEQQMVEIAKAFRAPPAVLILDEPTASLTDKETDRLFELIAKAHSEGVGVIYITHRMAEISRIGDRITVLRDGRKVQTLPLQDADDNRLLELMTGRVISEVFPRIDFRPGDILLEVDRLSTTRATVSDASIEVRGGEVVGLAGLVGSGKGEIGRACFGLVPIAGGKVRLGDAIITLSSTREILNRGLYYLPSDRRADGLMLNRSAKENITLAQLERGELSRFGMIRLAQEARLASRLAEKVQLRPFDIQRPAEEFSGGNQQKIMIAKALLHDAKVIIFDEPTVGVDVGTRVAIYEYIKELCEAGVAILLISSDLPEILHLTHRTYVMHRGRITAELQSAEITEENVLRHCFG